MYCPDYYLATNAAYKTLAKSGFEVPVKVSKILKQFEDISLISYSEAARRRNMSHSEITEYFGSDFGYLSRDPHDPWKAVIFYNDKKSVQAIRFTIAHELGHYVLGHLDDDDVSQKEANCYARNILCPVPIGHTIKENKIEKYMETFNISEPMARTTIELIPSDLYYISDEMYDAISDEYESYQFMKLLNAYFSEPYNSSTSTKKAP